MQKILITGSNGLLGQKLIYQLTGYPEVELYASSRGENRTLLQKRYKYFSLDITNQRDVDVLVDQIRPDVIINTAAMTNVDACEEDKEGCWDLNVNATSYLVSASERINAHLIHLSTDFIFDGEDGPYDEEAQPNPLSYYGESKVASEEIVKQAKCTWAIARTVLVYGVVDNMSRSNIVLWAKGALEKNSELTVVDDQFRSPTLAEDLAHGCVLIAQKKAEGVFNISGGEYMCVIDLVKRVARYFNLDESKIKPISSSTLNQAAKRPPRTGFVLDKAIKQLGYKPSSFEDGLGIIEVQLYAGQNEE